MQFNFTCPNCQKNLSVASEHIGKKAKCPACQTISVIEDHPANEPEVFEPLPVLDPQPPSQNRPEPNRFSAPLQNTNPYQSVAPSGRPHPTFGRQYNAQQADVPGIISVVLGGLSVLSLMLCFCIGIFGLFSLGASVAGLILSFYAQPPLKLIGMIMNSIVLGLCFLGFVATIAVWILVFNGALA